MRLAGNRVTSAVMRHGLAVPKRTNNAADVIRAWPLPEAGSQPVDSIAGFKCHSAVVYWLLLELLGNDQSKATGFLRELHQSGGPSMNWVSDALGYDDQNPVNGPDDCVAGDVLYLPNRQLPMHSVVVLSGDRISGYNNGGTWGKPGDQWTEESIAADQWAKIEEGKYSGRMGLGVNSEPVHKVSHTHALASLKKYAPRIALLRLTP